MKENEFRDLLEKYTAGQCTEPEKALLESWYLSLEEGQEAPSKKDLDQASRAVWASSRPPKTNKSISYLRIGAAAAILTVTAISFYFLRPSREELIVVEHSESPARAIEADVLPGGNRAILTLSDGSAINLDVAQMGRLAEQGGTGINKTGQGQVAYGSSESKGDSKPLFNIITTPRGGQFQIVLPDGTRVWLNAASSLKFPTVFSQQLREVTLTGEAYFEVAPIKSKPFLVSSEGSVIEVLGTHFNIMAYEDEVFTTTLLEGSVRVKHGTSERVIHPGQEARVNGLIKVKEADVENAIAWKNGLTVFNNSSIESIMRQISRWYDLDVTYKGTMPQRLFTGKIPRGARLSQLLKVLELSDINFKIEEKKLIVTP